MTIDPGIATVISAIVAGIVAIVVAKISKGKNERRILAKVKGNIYKPTSGEQVPRTIDCEGKASIKDTKFEVTLLLAIETVGLIWPKDAAIIPDDSGRWAATIREEGSPDSFSISLWAVTPKGFKEIQAWFDHGRASNDYPGLSMIPGARRLAAVTGLYLSV